MRDPKDELGTLRNKAQILMLEDKVDVPALLEVSADLAELLLRAPDSLKPEVRRTLELLAVTMREKDGGYA